MILLQRQKKDSPTACPYLPNRDKQFRYFYAKDLTESDIAEILAQGWRKFGLYYFRPNCPTCQECVPLRVLTQSFTPSKSQRKNLRRNSHIEVKFGPLRYSKRAFELYQDHSENRFGQETNLKNFLFNFYQPSCPALQSEYYLDDKLIGIGYLDQGSNCLSSVYFVYDTAYSKLGLGTFSIIKEIEHAAQQGLPYYYLGYYIQDCQSMAYKDRFTPREHHHWPSKSWRLVEYD